jgi:hypothetical protein
MKKQFVEKEVIRQLDELIMLEENWDDEGSPKIDDNIIKYSLALIKSLDNSIIMPFLAPISGGNLQFEWHLNETEYFEVEIDFDGSLKSMYEKNGHFFHAKLNLEKTVEAINRICSRSKYEHL